MPKLSHLKYLYLKHRFKFLFYSLIVSFILGPLSIELGISRDFFLLMFGINLGIALHISRKKWLSRGLAPLGLALSLLILDIWFESSTTTLPGGVLGLSAAPILALLAFSATIYTFLYAMGSREVDSECIHAALSAYLLLGFSMGILFWFLNLAQPGSFLVAAVPSEPDHPFGTFLYFSFVTLSTTGYGDILPVSELARGFSIAEAVVGQLYLASMLARLVSIYSQRRES